VRENFAKNELACVRMKTTIFMRPGPLVPAPWGQQVSSNLNFWCFWRQVKVLLRFPRRDEFCSLNFKCLFEGMSFVQVFSVEFFAAKKKSPTFPHQCWHVIPDVLMLESLASVDLSRGGGGDRPTRGVVV